MGFLGLHEVILPVRSRGLRSWLLSAPLLRRLLFFRGPHRKSPHQGHPEQAASGPRGRVKKNRVRKKGSVKPSPLPSTMGSPEVPPMPRKKRGRRPRLSRHWLEGGRFIHFAPCWTARLSIWGQLKGAACLVGAGSGGMCGRCCSRCAVLWVSPIKKRTRSGRRMVDGGWPGWTLFG